MAHLAIVIDEDGARRTAFVRRARSLFADLPGAIVADATVGSLACVWAHGPRAPVSIARCGDTFAILIGYAIDDDGRWITAADLAGRWLGQESAAGVFDGYHVAAAYDTVRGLAAAVDPCGMFPLHHAMCGEAALVATTPEAFRCHDAFTERVDREGLAGILLVNGPLQDRPLVAGESRLPRGHRLSWSHGGGLATKAVHRSAGTPPPAGETPADAVRRIDHELIRAIRRHRPVGVPTSLMLSGGLDSRLVAGCLADEGISVRAVTLGGPDDFEVVAGRAVAERLGMPHVVVSQETGGDEFVAHVRRAVRFTHLTAGPTGDDLGLGLGLSGTPDPFFWSGIAFDWVFEPISASDGLDTATGTWSFERLLSVMNRMGVAPQDLAALLGSDGAELLAAVIDRLRAPTWRPSPSTRTRSASSPSAALGRPRGPSAGSPRRCGSGSGRRIGGACGATTPAATVGCSRSTTRAGWPCGVPPTRCGRGCTACSTPPLSPASSLRRSCVSATMIRWPAAV